MINIVWFYDVKYTYIYWYWSLMSYLNILLMNINLFTWILHMYTLFHFHVYWKKILLKIFFFSLVFFHTLAECQRLFLWLYVMLATLCIPIELHMRRRWSAVVPSPALRCEVILVRHCISYVNKVFKFFPSYA